MKVKNRISALAIMICMLSALFGIPAGAEGDYPYTVGNIYFTDLAGKEIDEVNGSCMVNLTVTKNSYRSQIDSIILSAYSSDGELIGFYMMRGSMSVATDTEFGALVRVPEGKKMGKVKAYVWDSLEGMKALSNTAEREVNAAEEPPEKYIPDYFTVKGYVSDTYKNNTALLPGEVHFAVTEGVYDYSDCETSEEYDAKKKRYEDIYEYYGITFDGLTIKAETGDFDLTDCMYQTAEVTFTQSESGIYAVKDFDYGSIKNTVLLDASLFDKDGYTESDLFDGNYIKNGAKIKYYETKESQTSTQYSLDGNLYMFVNGVEITANKDNMERYVINNPVGAVKLADTDGDMLYDILFAQYFGTAMVDSVNSQRISFADQVNVGRSSIMLSDEIEYRIYCGEEEISVEDIKKGDILSIAYDVSETNVSYSRFLEIYVSRDTYFGMCTYQDFEEETVIIGENEYSFVRDYSEMSADMEIGDEYTVYLDKFGRIFSYDAAPNKLAIIDGYYRSSGYDNMLGQFYLGDGTQKIMEIDSQRVGMAESDIEELIYYNGTGSNSDKKPIENRVVEYKVSSSDKIVYLDFLYPLYGDTKEDYIEPYKVEYRASTNSIGTVKMNSDTKVIDATRYFSKWIEGSSVSCSDLQLLDSSCFVDGVEYAAFRMGRRNTDETYPFVIVTMGESEYTESTRFAVAAKPLNPKINDAGEEGYLLTVLYDGSLQEFFVSGDVIVNGEAIGDNYLSLVKEGDVLVFRKDLSNNISAIDTIFNASAVALGDDYDTTVSKSLTPDFGSLVNIPPDAEYWTKAWDPTSSDLTTSLVYGVITDKNKSYFRLSQVAYGTISDYTGDYTGLYTALDKEVVSGDDVVASTNGGYIDVFINDDTKVYVFDYSVSRKNDQLYVGVLSDIIKTYVPQSQLMDVDGCEYIPWEADADGETVAEYNQIYFAFAKVVNGEATDVFVIKSE